MPIYAMTHESIQQVRETSFGAEGIREREDLQRLLRKNIEIISPDTLIIAEEFCEWEDSRCRIDLLGLDKNANLVVIELKRTEDGGHMEWQAIRYAAMVSTMTFDKAVEVYAKYLEQTGGGNGFDARASLLEFLGWFEEDDEQFNQDVRIVLVSAEFSKELTTTVLWLNDREMDIRCIRIKPYKHEGGLLLVDVQQVIPIPESSAYQVRLREKTRKKRMARESAKNLTKYSVTVNGVTESRLPKRRAILRVVKHLCSSGIKPEQIAEQLSWYRKALFQSVPGRVSSEEFTSPVTAQLQAEGKKFDAIRYYCDQDDLIVTDGKTYAFWNQWDSRTEEAIAKLLQAFPGMGITCEAND